MKNKKLNKNIKLTVRVNKIQYDRINKQSKRCKKSRSSYLVDLAMKSSTKSAYNAPKLRPMNDNQLTDLNTRLSNIFDELNKFRLDYARALANLEHDNRLYNLGKLSSIPEKTLQNAEIAVITNKGELQDIENQIKRIEATIYDS